MITRAKLQEKTLDELRQIAASLEVADHETLQKTKLIAAIVKNDGFDASSELDAGRSPFRRGPSCRDRFRQSRRKPSRTVRRPSQPTRSPRLPTVPRPTARPRAVATAARRKPKQDQSRAGHVPGSEAAAGRLEQAPPQSQRSRRRSRSASTTSPSWRSARASSTSSPSRTASCGSRTSSPATRTSTSPPARSASSACARATSSAARSARPVPRRSSRR